MTAHWGVPDPAAVHGSAGEVQRAYSAAFSALDRRISLFLSLPLETLDALALQEAIQNIGKQ
jgi:arsenate reductase